MDVTLRHFDGCPNWETALERIRSVMGELDVQAPVRVERVETDEEAKRLDFHGSPTVLIDGVDPFSDGTGDVGLACRIYETPDGPAGLPTREQLRAVISATRNDRTDP